MTSDKAWHTEEHAQNAQLWLQCHMYKENDYFLGERSTDFDRLLPSLYVTVVSQNTGADRPYPLAKFDTCIPPKVAWVKVFMQGFGFGMYEESELRQEPAFYGMDVAAGFFQVGFASGLSCKIDVEVRDSLCFQVNEALSQPSHQDRAQSMRLAGYLHSIDDAHEVHNSTETGAPWHIAPHTEGASYMECSTFKKAGKRFCETVVSEHRNGATSNLLRIQTAVQPTVSWIKVYGEAVGVPPLNQPDSLQVLASRVAGVPIPKGY